MSWDAASVLAEVEDNLFDLFGAIGALPGGAIESAAAHVRYATGIVSPMFNAVGRARVGDDPDPSIVETVAWFAGREVPAWFWWTGPQTEPADLGDRLEAHGLIPFERGWVGMARRLDVLPATRPASGLRVEPVADMVGMARWATTFCAAFGVPAFAGEAWVEAARRGGVGTVPWRHATAVLDGVPVGVGLWYAGPRSAGIYGLATAPEARGRGVGAALTAWSLQEARERGYRLAVLHATPEGHGLYRRLGFDDVCAIDRFLWLRDDLRAALAGG